MKKPFVKTVFFIFLAAAAAAAFFFFSGRGAGARGGIAELSVSVFDSELCTVYAQPAGENEFRLYLPCDTDFSSARLYFEADTDVRLERRRIRSGDVCSAITGEGEYRLSAGSTDYKLFVFTGSEIPAVFISTESGNLDYIHADKENKEKGRIAVAEKGGLTFEGGLSSVKGRGNSFMESRKKSYNIKLEDKQSLFGMDPAKKWSLVAADCDYSAPLKWQIGFALEEYMGIYSAGDGAPADLYINGEYRGMYLVCESVQIAEGRVDITDLEKLNEQANPDIDIEKCAPCGVAEPGTPGSRKWVDIPVSPEDITGGYLLEFDAMDAYGQEASAFISPNGQCIVVKEPEYCSEAEIDYIADWYALAEEALISEDGYNSLGKHYSEYYDVDSLARMYILQEFTQNLDASFSSCFFYKDKGDGKLYAGPAWDFDLIMFPQCRIAGHSMLYCDRWYVNVFAADTSLIPSIYNSAYRHDDFVKTVIGLWKEFTEKGLLSYCRELTEQISASTEKSTLMNRFRWNDDEPVDVQRESEDMTEIKNTIFEFLDKKTQALHKGYAEDCSMLYYDPNGGSGFLYTNFITSFGEQYAVLQPELGQNGIKPADEEHVFKCWNTAKDGSGTDYYPGDKLTANTRRIILYAQWEPKSDG